MTDKLTAELKIKERILEIAKCIRESADDFEAVYFESEKQIKSAEEAARLDGIEKTETLFDSKWREAFQCGQESMRERAAKVFPLCDTDHSKIPEGKNCFFCFYGDKIRALHLDSGERKSK